MAVVLLHNKNSLDSYGYNYFGTLRAAFFCVRASEDGINYLNFKLLIVHLRATSQYCRKFMVELLLLCTINTKRKDSNNKSIIYY